MYRIIFYFNKLLLSLKMYLILISAKSTAYCKNAYNKTPVTYGGYFKI